MGKMMNFGRYTPQTTDPQGRRIADPLVHKKKFGTGEDQVTVSSWPEMRAAYKKWTPEQQYHYNDGTQVEKYLKGDVDYLDDVNIEEPTVTKGGFFQYGLKKGSKRYNDAQAQYGDRRNRENTKLYLDSGMSQQEWAKQPEGVQYSTNPLIDNPLGEGMQYNFNTDNTQDDFRMPPSQSFNIRYKKPEVEKNVKTVKPEVKTPDNTTQNYTEESTKAVPAPVKPTYTKEELTINKLKTLPVGKIDSQQGPIKRIVDPNEPAYKGAGMIDTSPKGQKVQQQTNYNAEKRAADAVKASETGQRMEFTGGAVNKKDLGYQAKYNKQYDKFQAEKDKNPMNNKTLEMFYSKRFQ